MTDTHKTTLVVLNEHTLGYIHPRQPDVVFHLHASALRGAPLGAGKDSSPIGASDTVRLARPEDFEAFQVTFDGYNNSDEYTFDDASTTPAPAGPNAPGM